MISLNRQVIRYRRTGRHAVLLKDPGGRARAGVAATMSGWRGFISTRQSSIINGIRPGCRRKAGRTMLSMPDVVEYSVVED